MTTTMAPPQRNASHPQGLAALLVAIGDGMPDAVVEIGTSPGAVLEQFRRLAGPGSDRPLRLEAVSLAELAPPAGPWPDPPAAAIALCLEGAETLPAAQAPELVRWLTQAADVVVFAAALPGQIGLHHIHCQPTRYWCDLFELCGFRRYDILRQPLLSDATIPWQQRQSLMLYARLNSPRERELRQRHPHNFLPEEFELVHHTMVTNGLLFRAAPPETPSIGELVRAVPAALGESVRARLSVVGEQLARLRHR
jgi:hypothetical protein